MTTTDYMAQRDAIAILLNHVDDSAESDRWFTLSLTAKLIRLSAVKYLRESANPSTPRA